jgi:hypothetical protein
MSLGKLGFFKIPSRRRRLLIIELRDGWCTGKGASSICSQFIEKVSDRTYFGSEVLYEVLTPRREA